LPPCADIDEETINEFTEEEVIDGDQLDELIEEAKELFGEDFDLEDLNNYKEFSDFDINDIYNTNQTSNS